MTYFPATTFTSLSYVFRDFQVSAEEVILFAVYRMYQFLPLQKASIIKILINYLQRAFFSFEIKSSMSHRINTLGFFFFFYSWLLKKLTHSKITENSSVWMFLILLLRDLLSCPDSWNLYKGPCLWWEDKALLLECILHAHSIYSVNFYCLWHTTLFNAFPMSAFHSDNYGKNQFPNAY